MNRIEKFIEIASKNPEFEGALVTSPQNRFYMLNMHSSAELSYSIMFTIDCSA